MRATVPTYLTFFLLVTEYTYNLSIVFRIFDYFHQNRIELYFYGKIVVIFQENYPNTKSMNTRIGRFRRLSLQATYTYVCWSTNNDILPPMLKVDFLHQL
jgi:hypothetical protein